jgi:formylglycine-generating enzyme
MKKKKSRLRGRRYIVLATALLTVLFLYAGDRIVRYTSTNEFCYSCHAHPHAEASWKRSVHYDNRSGIFVQCAQCHLPPPGNLRYLLAKAKHGANDVYHQIFTGPENINWEAKKNVEAAVRFTYDESCIKCHQNLFPMQLSRDGQQSHLYYNQNQDDLSCLNCHLYTGHYSDIVQKGVEFGGESVVDREIFTEPAVVEEFNDFTERIPGTAISFDMVAIDGGTFQMGSPQMNPIAGKTKGRCEAFRSALSLSGAWR